MIVRLFILISFFFLKSTFLFSQVFLPVDLDTTSVDEKLPVHSIFIDEDNYKWVGTEKGVYQIEEVTEEALINANEFLPKTSILHIKNAHKNKTWFITYSNEIIIVDNKTKKQEKQNFEFLKGKIVSNLVFSDNAKTIWIASRGNGLWKKSSSQNAKPTKVEVAKNDKNINDIAFFNGMLWVATETGIYYKKNTSVKDKKHKFKSISDFTKGNKMKVYKNQLWVLGYDKKDKGILKSTKDGKKWTTYSLSESFEYQVPNIMDFDSEGNLWVAADRVAKFNPKTKKWTEFGEKQGFQSRSALSLAVDKNDNVWVGTEGRGLFVRVNYPEKRTVKEENTEQEIEMIENVEELKEEKTVAELLQTEKVENIKGKKLKLKVQFKTARADILPKFEDELNELVSFMKKNRDIRILIEGHTAPIGNAQKNQELSEQRAVEVRNYLIKKGISRNRIRTIGYGGTRPITMSREQMKENRRVEVIFVD